MIVLGIESSCDETAIALVQDGKKILSHTIASSVDIHRQFGGVFPELACRRHIDVIEGLLKEALTEAKLTSKDIDLIAVAKGPGLIGALLIGVQVAKGLAIGWKKPIVGVDHVEAHLYASFMSHCIPLPALGIVLSGGHTLILHMLSPLKYEVLSTTVDDAIGEAFDKVATLLGLPYPGGPEIEKLAKSGHPGAFPFKPGFVKKNPLHFSFSGLKTSVLYAVKGQNAQKNDPLPTLSLHIKADIAASFQDTAFRDVLQKAKKWISSLPCKSILFGGGVTANGYVRDLFAQSDLGLPLFWPEKHLSLDNAAMIAGLGYQKFLETGRGDPLDFEVAARTFAC